METPSLNELSACNKATVELLTLVRKEMSSVKIVLNKCYGGFELSEKAVQMLGDRKGRTLDYKEHGDNSFSWRTDSDLIAVVEYLGKAASGQCADLRVEEVQLPEPEISEYDGIEDCRFN